MRRDVDMQEISDGKLYESNDMTRVDCFGCEGCFDCCHGMGNSIVLDPLDVYRLTGALGVTFAQLLSEHLELGMVDGLILPSLRMEGEKETCTFLNEEGRCTIHAHRPGICRMFPLGRFYENRTFRYFLQIHECPREKKGKVKIKKWLDTPNIKDYENFVTQWHYFLKDLEEVLKNDPGEVRRKTTVMYLLKYFYEEPFKDDDFYQEFDKRLRMGRSTLGVF